MKRFSWKIAAYTVRTIIPYFISAWLLLSVILFIQQASRHSDILFSPNLPKNLIWQLTLALLPNVIAFTSPMAILVGVIIGLSKLQGDSELIVIRAAGVGNFQITIPIIFLGCLLSLFAFFINLKGVPIAAQIVRQVASQTALYKLESPIEPGVFNAEIKGFIIYVKDGDLEKGSWKNIFIYSEDKNAKQTRLITSNNGRIDASNEVSELVLEKASVTTFSSELPYKNLFSEKVENLRFVIQTNRGELMSRLSKTEDSPEEMGLSELAAFADTQSGKEKIEINILWQRRILLSLTPLIFALLGAALVLRFNRAGRGFGIFLALVSLIIYYLLTLLGEQLARTEFVNVFAGGLIPLIITLAVIALLFLSQRITSTNFSWRLSELLKVNLFSKVGRKQKGNLFKFTTGILDSDIIINLLAYFLLTIGFLVSIYMIFTALELWKFAGSLDHGFKLLAEYLFFLLPLVYIQISPSALMIAVLATYVIKSRQNEIVTWTASGQSIYRLLLPCFILMMAIGFLNWEIQERVMPESNKIQDALRDQFRNRTAMSSIGGKYWVASANRIYSFELPENAENDPGRRQVFNLTIFEFEENGAKLQSLFKTDTAFWEKGRLLFPDKVEKTTWINGMPQTSSSNDAGSEVHENYNPFKQTAELPSHQSSADLSEKVKTAESESEQRNYAVALENKYATPFLPLIITLFTAPFALSLSRKGKVITIGYAVGIWLLFTGLTTIFNQFGISGYLAPKIAVWTPLLVFALIGSYLMSKVQT